MSEVEFVKGGAKLEREFMAVIAWFVVSGVLIILSCWYIGLHHRDNDDKADI